MAILNSALSNENFRGGAITDCMKDYGMGAVFFAYIFMVMGFGQVLRLANYLIFFMYPSRFFGYLEARTRADLAARPAQEQLKLEF